jgi:hypothetical protein
VVLTARPSAQKVTKPMRSVGKPALDHVGPMPFPALQSLFDPLYPPGFQWYWRADFFKEISDASIGASKVRRKLPTGHSTALYPINGRPSRGVLTRRFIMMPAAGDRGRRSRP